MRARQRDRAQLLRQGCRSFFTGVIKWIELESGDDGHDHLIDPEMVVRAAMHRQ